MGVSLSKGGNVSLNKQAPGLTSVRVGLGWQTPVADYDLDASALLCGQSGQVLSDQHFIFSNNLRSPDGSVQHSANDTPGGRPGENEHIRVDLATVPVEVAKIVFPVSIYAAEQRRQNFGQIQGAHIRVSDQETGTELAHFNLPGGASAETDMVFGELYHHGTEWKFRAVGQGYASGLAGIATDYGVDLMRPSPQPRATSSQPPVPPAPSAPPPHKPGTGRAPGLRPAPAPPQPTGSSSATCFFDPNHGPGSTAVPWSPQWGTPRQIQACGGCAQRVQTTPPPYYTTPQAGYPQPPQQGYPQPGYPEQPRRFGTGAVIGAGAAGLVGGALLNEALSDDEPDVTVNQYYEGGGDGEFGGF